MAFSGTRSTALLSAAAVASSVVVVAAYAWVRLSLPRGDDSLVSSKRALCHTKFKPSSSTATDENDVIIIGSGMAGLTCAAILARLGKRVVVLEQHPDVAGGGTHMFEIKGYQFDSGLHYTVPWSVPLLALTTGKPVSACTPFDLMGEEDGTVDKIYLVNTTNATPLEGAGPFKMKYLEAHIPALHALFPKEKAAIDSYMRSSYRSMLYVQVFLLARLLPKAWQRRYWSLLNWLDIHKLCCVDVTAQQWLPTITQNKALSSLLSSMWIDTGARPDKASFMMTASVFRGISMEGGCYPRGGSGALAEELVRTIESHGGKVLIRAMVKEILVDDDKVVGVRVGVTGSTAADSLMYAPAIVSSAGYSNTFSKLVSAAVTSRLGIPREIGEVGQSAGFVMANIGIKASPRALGITNTNTWHIPVNDEGDCYPPLETYFANPDSCSSLETPAFITFPSVKDLGEQESATTSCQILYMAEYSWFERFRNNASSSTTKASDRDDVADYNKLKKTWEKKSVELLVRYFPLCSQHIEVVDISTPLSIEQYLNAHRGAAVGLDVTPERFCDDAVREKLDVVTPVKGLFLTGQDMGFLGVTLCQLTGVLTAFRMAGFTNSLKIVAASVFRGWGI